MKKNQIKKIKSNSGITMTDLVIALGIITLFTGIITTLLYSATKINFQTKMSSASLNYAIEILEDIDKISYNDVRNGMEEAYRAKFSIPQAFKLSVDVSNYKEENTREDIIKKVELTISYEMLGSTENLVIQRLKVKEL